MIAPVEKTDELLAELKALDDPIVNAVAEWEARVGEDWAGDPAVRVIVTFKDSDIRAVWHSRRVLEEAIYAAAARWTPGRYPYITFTSQSDWIDPNPPPRKRKK